MFMCQWLDEKKILVPVLDSCVPVAGRITYNFSKWNNSNSCIRID